MPAPLNTILIPSTTVTGATTGYSDTITGVIGAVGAIFMVNTSAISVGGNLALTLQCYDPATGTYIDLASFVAITATGSVQRIVYPNASGALYQVLPAQARIKYVLTGTTPSVTFSVGASFLP